MQRPEGVERAIGEHGSKEVLVLLSGFRYHAHDQIRSLVEKSSMLVHDLRTKKAVVLNRNWIDNASLTS